MKLTIIILVFSIIICACSSAPSESVIQTAIAKTLAASSIQNQSTSEPSVSTIAIDATNTIGSTDTPIPSHTPLPTNTPKPTNTPRPTATPRIGTFDNPIPIGVGYSFPGFGTLTVVGSMWNPGETGFAIVQLMFQCERPKGQECDTGDFMIDAVGYSGNGYDRDFDTAIPEPDFGTFTSPTIYGGGTEVGYVCP